LGGTLSESDLQSKISTHQTIREDYEKSYADNDILLTREVAALCAELEIVPKLREKEKEKNRELLPPHLRLGLSIEGIKEYINPSRMMQ